MNTRALVLASTLLTFAGSAFGQIAVNGGIDTASAYVGASAGLLRYDESGLNTLTPSVILVRVGVPITSYFAVEGRLGTGLSSDESHGFSVSNGVFGGAYVKGSLALAPTVALYAVAGIATDSLHRNYGDGDTTDTGFSFGVGSDVALSRGFTLNFEWTHLPGGSESGFSYDANLFTAGVNFHF
jgi:opacity protein-like surface antigen